MKYGLKLWSVNKELFDLAIKNRDKYDYIELLYVPGKIKGVEKLVNAKIPIIVHSPTSVQGVNLSSINLKESKNSLKEVINFSNMVSAKKIILHPDFGDINNLLLVLNEVFDSRFVIENMPLHGINKDLKLCCYSKKEIKKIIDQTNIDFCLDITHAIKTAISLGIDYKSSLNDIVTLKPTIAHVSGCNLSSDLDEHLDIFGSEIDVPFIKDIIKKNNVEYITFEVPKAEGIQNDLKNINYFC